VTQLDEAKECLAITKETSNKVEKVIEAYEKKDKDCDDKNKTIKSQSITIRIQAVIIGICFFLFIYSYFYAPYAAGNINANNSGGGNAVVAVG
jgi:hypothetical protein